MTEQDLKNDPHFQEAEAAYAAVTAALENSEAVQALSAPMLASVLVSVGLSQLVKLGLSAKHILYTTAEALTLLLSGGELMVMSAEEHAVFKAQKTGEA